MKYKIIALLAVALSSVATAYIDHRQAILTVIVKDSAGEAIQGASVEIEMLNPSFRWGASVDAFEIVPDPFAPRAAGDTAFNEGLVEHVQQFFNSITFGNRMKWGPYETYQSRYPDENVVIQAVDAVFALKAFGGSQNFSMRGHATFWQSSYAIPADVRNSVDEEYIRTRLYAHIDAYHKAFAGRIVNFDLFNEPFHETLLVDKLFANEMEDEKIAEYTHWFKIAQEADPAARLFINDYNMLNDWTGDLHQLRDYKKLIDAMRDRGAPIAGIGLQAHVDRYLSQQTVRRRLDIMAAPMAPTENHPEGLPGLPIEITELDIGESNSTGNYWYGRCDAPDDNLQAEILENIIVAAFEHPAVEGVTVWGINDSEHWRGNGVLFDDSDPDNWILKPAGAIWLEYIMGTWWTDRTALTDDSGTSAQPVYKGMHRVKITVGEESKEFEWNILNNQIHQVDF